MQRFVFYHADRAGTLKEDQEINLDDNNLSYFGRAYWPEIRDIPVQDMNPSQKREYYLEFIWNDPKYKLYTSRLQSIFAANSIPEAIIFARSITPIPNHPIPIIEIIADRFWNLDSNWLDYSDDYSRLANYRSYWNGCISNHQPETGERRPPRIEVMIALPAKTGRIVHIVD